MNLLEHPFFSDISETEGLHLQERVVITEYEDESVIFTEGSPSEELCLILEGTVAFAKHTPDDKVRVISESHKGSFFGEVGIFTRAPRSLTAIASGRVVLGKLHRDHLVTFIRSTPGPIEQILGSIISHLHDTTSHYVETLLHQEKMGLVGTMVNSIIHDFKNPFTMISLGAQLLEKQYKDNDRTLKICRNINDQVQRMLIMANEIIDFSRGEHRMNFRHIALDELCATFYTLNEPFFQRDNVKIEMDIDPIVITAEPDKLLRVLQNLVGNAIEAYPASRTGTVRIRMKEQPDDTVRITVEDDAGGIPEPIRDTFFRPFVTHGKSKGTGLGTAIVKSIIEAHHGTIEFETETDKGTKFVIVLPREQAE